MISRLSEPKAETIMKIQTTNLKPPIPQKRGENPRIAQQPNVPKLNFQRINSNTKSLKYTQSQPNLSLNPLGTHQYQSSKMMAMNE